MFGPTASSLSTRTAKVKMHGSSSWDLPRACNTRSNLISVHFDDGWLIIVVVSDPFGCSDAISSASLIDSSRLSRVYKRKYEVDSERSSTNSSLERWGFRLFFPDDSVPRNQAQIRRFKDTSRLSNKCNTLVTIFFVFLWSNCFLCIGV